MTNTFIKAQELKIGDNVWGHNLVNKIEVKGNTVTLNDTWTAEINEEVMVTNR